MNTGLGTRLIELRSALGLTQEKFAEKIRVSKGYMSSLEQGHRELNFRLIKLIADTFGVNETWLATGEGVMFVNKKNIELMEIVDLFNKLHPDLRPLVIEQLKILLKINNKSIGPVSNSPDE
ncbi:MAG: helix-turn-helix transcriptional regulator [Spirochaetaceae bacterium]|jgi:transcriptional regulator with XRE-family HTH domain|nr:helix-turn-helix transcriptional regulator [Spirochaetaceae bacterium]